MLPVPVHVYPMQVLQNFCRERSRLICQIDRHDLAFLLFEGNLTLFQHFFVSYSIIQAFLDPGYRALNLKEFQLRSEEIRLDFGHLKKENTKKIITFEKN